MHIIKSDDNPRMCHAQQDDAGLQGAAAAVCGEVSRLPLCQAKRGVQAKPAAAGKPQVLQGPMCRRVPRAGCQPPPASAARAGARLQLLVRHAQVDEQPAQQARVQLAELLEVQAAQARVQLAAHEEVVQRRARAAAARQRRAAPERRRVQACAAARA